MRYNYKLSNIYGAVYNCGNVLFRKGGELLSPVGNRVKYYDLKRGTSRLLPIETRSNIIVVELSSNGHFLLISDESGYVYLFSMIRCVFITKHRFSDVVTSISFSPNNKYFCLASLRSVYKYLTPAANIYAYNPFVLESIVSDCNDIVTCIKWTPDSSFFAVGSDDMVVNVYDARLKTRSKVATLGSQASSIVNIFFTSNQDLCYSLGCNGKLCCWSTELGTFVDRTGNNLVETENNIRDTLKFFLKSKKNLTEQLKEEVVAEDRVRLTCADFHDASSLLVTAYSNGAFMLHEMPDCVLIHTLVVSEKTVSNIAIDQSGEWVCLACSGSGQLVVWEWKSQTYVLKQQAHASNMTCMDYSPSGDSVVTGGQDGKVKLWNVESGFCFMTFVDHTDCVTDVAFCQSGRALLSSSADGTVRAFDTARYRNFRTLSSPQPAQYTNLAVDTSSELVAASTKNSCEIHLWSLKLGKLLEVISGHESPVSSIVFSPSLTSSQLVSTSWDKQLHIWNFVDSKLHSERIDLLSDGLAVAFRPDSGQLAVATLSGQIRLIDTSICREEGFIEGRNDLDSGRSNTDEISAKRSLLAKSFTTLCYTADGEGLLAAGQSKNVCLYHVSERLLLTKFVITQNRSFDGVDDFIDRRKMTDFGNVALVEDRLNSDSIHLHMPAAKYGKMAARAHNPEIAVMSVRFSSSGDSFCVVSSEGLLEYSLNHETMFGAVVLQANVTQATVKGCSNQGKHTEAVQLALQLNIPDLTRYVMEQVPFDMVAAVVQSLDVGCVHGLLKYLSTFLTTSRHMEFYVEWIHQILFRFFGYIRKDSTRLSPVLCAVQRSLFRLLDSVGHVYSHNRYALEYLADVAQTRLTNSIILDNTGQ